MVVLLVILAQITLEEGHAWHENGFIEQTLAHSQQNTSVVLVVGVKLVAKSGNFLLVTLPVYVNGLKINLSRKRGWLNTPQKTKHIYFFLKYEMAPIVSSIKTGKTLNQKLQLFETFLPSID